MFPLYPFCWDFLNCKSILNFVKIFSRIYWVVYMVCILQFVKVVYYIDWFVDIESSLHTWGKSQWSWCMILLLYDWIVCILACLYFIEDFRIFVHQWYWPVISIFVCYLCLTDAGLVEWVEKHSFLCSFLEYFERVGC